mmetsp:Transcript_3329/g.20774  ORF Transcript_3329/g.20774 Transcript_3329/m.20774 type:complete len:152 (+) Transcript_3329:716-1171(+)
MERSILPFFLLNGDAQIFGHAQLHVHSYFSYRSFHGRMCRIGLWSVASCHGCMIQKCLTFFIAIKAKLPRIDQHNMIAQMAMIDNPTKAVIATRIANALASVLTPVARCTARNQLAQTGARPTAMAARSGFVAWLPAHTTARSFVAFPSDA